LFFVFVFSLCVLIFISCTLNYWSCFCLINHLKIKLLEYIVCKSHILCSLSRGLEECNVCFICMYAPFGRTTIWLVKMWHSMLMCSLNPRLKWCIVAYIYQRFALFLIPHVFRITVSLTNICFSSWSFPDTSTQVCHLTEIICSLDSCLCYGISLTVCCFYNTTSFMAVCFPDTIYHLVSFPRWLRELSVFSLRRRSSFKYEIFCFLSLSSFLGLIGILSLLSYFLLIFRVLHNTQLIRTRVEIPLMGLTSQYVCACLTSPYVCACLTSPYVCACFKAGRRFPSTYIVVLFVFNDLRWEMDVCFCWYWLNIWSSMLELYVCLLFLVYTSWNFIFYIVFYSVNINCRYFYVIY
jgi:hypothetical protein